MDRLLYTVPTGGSVGSVKSAVLACGVSMFFLYIVPLLPISATLPSKSWPPSSSTGRKRIATASRASCWRLPACSTSSPLPVAPAPLSHVFSLPSLLLRPPQRHPQLDHPHHSHPAPHLLYRREELQGPVGLGLPILGLPPLHRHLDDPSHDSRIRLVQRTVGRFRRKLI